MVVWNVPQALHSREKQPLVIKYLIIERERERKRERQTDRQADRQTDRQKDRQTDRDRDRQTDKRTDRQTDRQPNRHRERQRDRETGRQRETKRQRGKERHRETKRQILTFEIRYNKSSSGIVLSLIYFISSIIVYSILHYWNALCRCSSLFKSPVTLNLVALGNSNSVSPT